MRCQPTEQETKKSSRALIAPSDAWIDSIKTLQIQSFDSIAAFVRVRQNVSKRWIS